MRLRDRYYQKVMPQLKEKFGYRSDLAVPRIIKVTINSGFNPTARGENYQQEVAAGLAAITGQKPKACQARKAISGFKTRQGMIVGLKVTLRGQRMYDFLERLINVALPRGRDFRGVSERCVDQTGNFNLGLKEQIIFPEISAEHVSGIFGFEITVTTNAGGREQGLELFRWLGFPFKKD